MRKRQRKKNAKKSELKHFCVFVTSGKKPKLYINGKRKNPKIIGLKNYDDLRFLCRYLNIPLRSNLEDDMVIEWTDKYNPVWHVKDWLALNEVKSIKRKKFYLVGDEWPRKC